MEDAPLFVSFSPCVVHFEAADLQQQQQKIVSGVPVSAQAFITVYCLGCAAYGGSISLPLGALDIRPVSIIAVLRLLATASSSLILSHPSQM